MASANSSWTNRLPTIPGHYLLLVPGYAIQVDPMPNWWHRFWVRLVFGFRFVTILPAAPGPAYEDAGLRLGVNK